MKRHVIRATVAISLVTAGLIPALPTQALPTFPSGYGDITPTVNWSEFISPIMNSSSIECTLTSVSNYSNVSYPDIAPGKVLKPTENLLTDGLRLQSIVSDPDADVGANCTSVVTVPSTTINVTGTIAAPNMPAEVGTTGNMALKCKATTSTPTITVNVGARFGGGVPGKARITGNGSTGSVQFDCGLALSFSSDNSLAGSVNGTLAIGDTASNPSCADQNTPTCIPVGLVNATVAISAGSGALAAVTGSGTYSFNDSFKLSGIDGVLSNVGVSSVRAQSIRPSLAANTDELRIQLSPGKHTAKLVASNGKSISVARNSSLTITSSPASKCNVTAKFKRTAVTLGSPKISSFGDATLKISNTAVKKLKSAGAKKNTKISISTSCKLGTKTATSKTSGKFSG